MVSRMSASSSTTRMHPAIRNGYPRAGRAANPRGDACGCAPSGSPPSARAGAPAPLRPGELHALEDEGRGAHRGVTVRVVSHRREPLPQLEVVPGDVHLAHGLGKSPAPDAEPPHPE